MCALLLFKKILTSISMYSSTSNSTSIQIKNKSYKKNKKYIKIDTKRSLALKDIEYTV
jgi:hypothetical protein